jgi:TPR repeat protein
MRRAAALTALLLAAGTALAGDDNLGTTEAIVHYDQGRFAEALRLFEPAAEAGDATAQYHLGLMHARGEGVTRDLPRAAAWFERAADGGNAHAQFLIGHMYAKGEGVPVDRVLAHVWFSAAAASGWWKAREARERLVDAGMTPQEVSLASARYKAWASMRDERER